MCVCVGLSKRWKEREELESDVRVKQMLLGKYTNNTERREDILPDVYPERVCVS